MRGEEASRLHGLRPEADYPLGRQGDRLGHGRLGGPGNDNIVHKNLAKKEYLTYFSSFVVFLILAIVYVKLRHTILFNFL